MMSLLSLYKKYISPLIHLFGKAFFGSSFACRHSPTCSVFFATAVRKYGIIHGSILGLARLSRCHPYSKTPHLDPVP